MDELDGLKIEWVKKGERTWLLENLDKRFFNPPMSPNTIKIASLEADTNKLGPKPVWNKYEQLQDYNRSPERSPDQVRISYKMGQFFEWLVKQKKPSIVAEFGTAFGFSGMYFLSGLEQNEHGKLLTFEPNKIWQEIAKKNLAVIGSRFKSIVGTFEENIDIYLDKKIDLIFIDAIHTSEFMLPQFELVVERTASGGLILLDDLNSSKDMAQCWEKISKDSRVKSALLVEGRVGMVEL